MDFWKFADQNLAGLAFLAMVLGLLLSLTVAHLWSRLMRHLNVRSKGWPPPHLDADGDFAPKEEQPDVESNGVKIRF